jgi:hypothetical protein
VLDHDVSRIKALKKMLNEIQIRILNSLMDDDESVETTKSMLKNIDNFNADNEEIIETLIFLFENKYIACLEPKYVITGTFPVK